MQSDANSLGTDNQLLARLKSGDLSALTPIYTRHVGLMRREARMQGVRPHDRDDVLQETLLALMRHVAAWDDSRVDAVRFLKMVARHVARNWVRSEVRREARLQAAAVGGDAQEGGPRDFSGAAEEALARLHQSQRSAVQLVYLEERSHYEAAAIMGVSVAVSKTRLSRAMAFLREEFKPTCA